MAKTKVQLQDVADILTNAVEAFQAPTLVAALNTTITDLSGNPRKLADPSETIRPAMGIERLHTKSIKLVQDEKGPNGEQVWKLTNGEDRVRFVGSWSNPADTNGTRSYNSTANDYVEITFYGTGLNILSRSDGGARDFRATIDGGSEGTNFWATSSSILSAGNYNVDMIVPAIPAQSLGIHTVKIRYVSGGSLEIYGFEILNESTQIKIPQGRILSNGRATINNSLQSIDYNTDFASGTLGTKGGRVVVYSQDGQIKKALQPTDASQLNLASADHSNEEVIRKINFREFGANRGDDFSTLTTTSNRAFTLDDGTTTLVGLNCGVGTVDGSDQLGTANSASNFNTITFIGTGLDIVTGAGALTWNFSDILINGNSIGGLTANSLTTKIYKIVSGLSYGTHTIKFFGSSLALGMKDFIIYGPKKPAIPADAQEISEYYLMGNFSANATASVANISAGVLRKASTREHVYVGTWTLPAVSVLNLSGFIPFTGTTSSYTQYTFFGTGLDYRFSSNSVAGTFVITLTDAANPGGTSNLSGFTTSSYGAGIASFTASTGTIVTNATGTNNMGVAISGLALGWHTIKITKTAGTGNIYIDAADIITPIHYPNTKVGSLSMGPAVQLQKETASGGVDLSKAKASILVDLATNTILTSNNISAVLIPALGQCIVYFEKPFKTNKYTVVSSGEEPYGGASFTLGTQVRYKTTSTVSLHVFDVTTPSTVNKIINAVFFGELEDEGDQ